MAGQPPGVVESVNGRGQVLDDFAPGAHAGTVGDVFTVQRHFPCPALADVLQTHSVAPVRDGGGWRSRFRCGRG